MTDLAFINAFRAFAALWVLVAHCLIWGGWSPFAVPPPKIAVDLFMLLSGFLMAHNAVGREALEPLSTPKGRMCFWLRRFFRLAPAYYLALALAIVLGDTYLDGYRALRDASPGLRVAIRPGLLAVDSSPESLLLHVSFLFGLHPVLASSTTLPDWSLTLEMQFYLAFPLIWLACRRFGPITAALVLSGMALVLSVAVSTLVEFREPSLLVFKLRYFMAGMLIFHAVRARGARLAALSVVAVALCAYEPTYGRQAVILPALAVLMLAAGVAEQRRALPLAVSAVLGSRAVRVASDISYGVYLFHGFWLAGAGMLLVGVPLGPTRLLALLAVVLPGACLTGWLVHRFVETPGIALGRRAISRRFRPQNVPKNPALGADAR